MYLANIPQIRDSDKRFDQKTTKRGGKFSNGKKKREKSQLVSNCEAFVAKYTIKFRLKVTKVHNEM